MHRLAVVLLALASLATAWIYLATISRTDPWYRNTDMNSHNMVDALSINADQPPNNIDQPGLPLKFLLALDYRIRHAAGILPVWNVSLLGACDDPLRQIPPLIRIERVHSRILVLLFILAAAGLIQLLTRDVTATCLTIILLCGCSGLLFHGLLIRPELLCVGFGNVLALLCTCRATMTRSWTRHHFWLFLAGIFVGLSALEKLPGVCYLAVCFCWCCLSSLAGRDSENQLGRSKLVFWGGLLPAAAGMSVLGLTFLLSKYQTELGAVVLLRLRLAAITLGLLPLVIFRPARHRFGEFIFTRCRELLLLAGGALAALPLSYLLLRTVMSTPSASDYLARTLHLLINPTPLLNILAVNPDMAGVFS